LEPRHGEAPARWHVVRKPARANQDGRRLESQPTGTSNATTRLTAIPAGVRNAYLKSQSGGYLKSHAHNAWWVGVSAA